MLRKDTCALSEELSQLINLPIETERDYPADLLAGHPETSSRPVRDSNRLEVHSATLQSNRYCVHDMCMIELQENEIYPTIQLNGFISNFS